LNNWFNFARVKGPTCEAVPFKELITAGEATAYLV
jgi:hypothetical protein